MSNTLLRAFAAGTAIAGMLATSAAAEVTLRLGDIVTTADASTMAAEKFAEMVKKRTNGDVTVKVFPNSQLGGERELVEGLQLGTVDMAIAGTGMLGQFYKPFYIMTFSYTFRDGDHVHKVLRGEIGQKLARGFEEATGIHILTMNYDRAPRHLLTKAKVKQTVDLSGVKLRVPENPMYLESWRALGASPTPVAWTEVYSSLQSGVVEGVEAPLPSLYNMKFYESAKKLALTSHLMEGEAVMISKRAWGKLTPKQREAITEAAVQSGIWQQEQLEQQDQESLGRLQSAGVEVTRLSPDEKQKWMEKVKGAVPKVKDIWGGGDLYERIQAVN